MSDDSQDPRSPIVIVLNDIDPDAVRAVSDGIDATIRADQSPFIIRIDSDGGYASSCCGIIDLIDAAKRLGPVATIAVGSAASAASFVLAHGTEGLRFAAPNCNIMVHPLQLRLGGSIDVVEHGTKDSTKLNARLFKIFGEDTKKGAKWWREELAKHKGADLNLTAQEAKRYGMVDHVQLPIVVAQPKIEYGFV